MSNTKTILHLCADTGSDSKPYRDNGYNVILVGSAIGIQNFEPPSDVYGIIANPPCTEFSTARSGGVARMAGDDPLFLVRECQRIIKACNPIFWVMENPATGILRDFLGRPNMVYQPWQFGSPWTKRTALWGKFKHPQPLYYNWESVPKNPNLYHRAGRGGPQMFSLHKSAFKLIPEFQGLKEPKTDAEFRSLCSQKFAQAFYEVNQ